MLRGITFDAQQVTSSDDALGRVQIYNDAVVRGCEVTTSEGKIYIGAGYFYIQGRLMQVVSSHEIDTPIVVSNELFCRVVFELDLKKENTDESFLQGSFVVLDDAEVYPTVVQGDLWGGDTLYQMYFARFKKDTGGISSLVEEYENFGGKSLSTNDYTTAEKNKLSALKTTADTTATLTVEGWSSNEQTVSVSGVSAINAVTVSPAPSSFKEYGECGVYCIAQSANSLTFECDTVPENALTINVSIRG